MPYRLIAFLLTLTLLTAGSVVQADETTADNPVLITYAAPELAPALFPDTGKEVDTASFCGACTTSDDCGTGWVCCASGCSDNKKMCYEAVSCDKVANEIVVPRLLASK